ncbi:MAG: undecaprenyl/decaprenyl-phosphate alpha-N-acetylglucosaminyl 1-phosphate transferase, partial [Pseudomonadota bacterium]|nr:undecaprenyl/decaprenyl-phosphate alpha-N-acetylglucosaminyl 1-phosphate transferase [Pseudomonadota bacterium]
MDARLVAASTIALAVTLFAIFSLRPMARRLGLVDKPDERKRHRGSVPLIGGMCFFLGTVVGLVYLGFMDPFVSALMAAGTLIVLTGVVDDVYDLSVRSRLVIQASAAFLVIAATGIYFQDAGNVLGTGGFPLGALGIPVTVIAVMGLMNAFNMLDGIDGLAATLAMVSIAAIMVFAGGPWPALGIVLLLQVLFASLIPYLCVNMGWPDGRKIFMGDAGSTLIGFLLGWSLVYLSSSSIARLAPVDALWCVALPIMDTLAVMQRRMRQGLSPFKADRQHIHHLLLDAGCTPRVALSLIVAVAGALAVVGFALRNAPEYVSGLAYLGVLMGYMFGFKPVLNRLQGPLTWLSGSRRSTGAG